MITAWKHGVRISFFEQLDETHMSCRFCLYLPSEIANELANMITTQMAQASPQARERLS